MIAEEVEGGYPPRRPLLSTTRSSNNRDLGAGIVAGRLRKLLAGKDQRRGLRQDLPQLLHRSSREGDPTL